MSHPSIAYIELIKKVELINDIENLQEFERHLRRIFNTVEYLDTDEIENLYAVFYVVLDSKYKTSNNMDIVDLCVSIVRNINKLIDI